MATIAQINNAVVKKQKAMKMYKKTYNKKYLQQYNKMMDLEYKLRREYMYQ